MTSDTESAATASARIIVQNGPDAGKRFTLVEMSAAEAEAHARQTLAAMLVDRKCEG